ncbi:High-affinity nicotinic acid transporter [Cryptotrichosporon argae]
MSDLDISQHAGLGDEKDIDTTKVVAVPADDEDTIVWTERDEQLKRSAIRKLDWTLVPIFGAIFMMASLDRSNIGNANLTGYKVDLGLVGNQYGACVSVVYATYVIFEPIYSILLKIVSARVMLTTSVACWAAITIGASFVQTYEQVIGTRILLGVAEAVCAPAIAIYLTMTYQRDEYVRRQTAIQALSALSGAFGGLLAFALNKITTGGLHGWRWMYLVEGLISAAIVPFAWFVIPNTPYELRWLNDAERDVLAKRAVMNRKFYDERDRFDWKFVRLAYQDWRTYVHAINHFGIDCTLYSITTFMPTLCAGLGFTSTVDAQLLTIPVYAIAATTFVLAGVYSDKFKLRSPFILFGLFANLVGYIMLLAAPQVGVRYAGVFIASIGLYIPTALNNLWAADNHAPHFKRATTCGTIVFVGNISGAIIGFIFTTQTSPRYIPGIKFVLGMTCMSILCTSVLLFGTWKKNQNKKAAIEAGAPDDRSLGDKNPHYPLFL